MDIKPWREVQDLIPQLSQAEYAQLKSSIAQDGVKVPILVMTDGRIIDGHHRWFAANELEIQPPYQVEDCDEPKGFILALILNIARRQLSLEQLTPIHDYLRQNREQRKEVAKALRDQGQTQEQVAAVVGVVQSTLAGWESEPDIPNIKNDNSSKPRDRRVTIPKAEHQTIYDLHQQGQTQEQIASEYKVTQRTISKIVAKVAKRLEKERKQREQQEAIAAIARQSITLYHDDAMTRTTLLDDGSIALAINDPPYNTTDNDWDQLGTPAEYLDWTRQWLAALGPKLKDDYHSFIFCAPTYAADIEMLLREMRWPIKSRIIWEYRNLVKGRDITDQFIVNYQMIFHCGTYALNLPPKWNDERFAVQVFATPQSNFNEGKHHPTQKPLGLIERLIKLGSYPGDTVLDMFAGSGTTALACQNVKGRHCILIEQADEYCRIIEDRLQITRETS